VPPRRRVSVRTISARIRSQKSEEVRTHAVQLARWLLLTLWLLGWSLTLPADLRLLALDDDDDDAAALSSAQPGHAKHKAVHTVRPILSALNDELRLVKSEVPPVSVLPSTAVELEDGFTGAAARRPAPNEPAPRNGPEEPAEKSPAWLVLEQDLSLWDELGLAPPMPEAASGEPVPDQEPPATKQDRHALEERARSILHQDSPALLSISTDAGADTEGTSSYLAEHGLMDGWEHAEHGEGSRCDEDQHVLGAEPPPAASSGTHRRPPPRAGSLSGGSGGSASASVVSLSASASLAADEDSRQVDDQMSASQLRARHQAQLDAEAGGHAVPSWIDQPSPQSCDAEEAGPSLLRTPDTSFVGTGVMAVNFDLSGLKMPSGSVGLGMKKLNE
jgi:hypothetical protein